jgi:glyoxylase-like metal-dependent hydrolase (beta-lactamase superfamily II)
MIRPWASLSKTLDRAWTKWAAEQGVSEAIAAALYCSPRTGRRRGRGPSEPEGVEENMALEIKILDYGDIELESSFLVLGRDCGRTRRVPTTGFLILGGTWPVLVDTGYRSNQIMETLGMRGLQSHETMIENQLKKHGLRLGDVRYVLHTHLHIDHAGKDDLFPMNTTVVLNRRELEYSVSGLMHPQYPAVDIKHLIDRLHTKGALRFLDLEISGPIELMPGVVCEAAGGHTEGSMNVIVKTTEGVATICGDVIYDFNDQLVEPFREIGDMEPRVTGNHGTTKRQEKAAIKKVMAASQFALPVHDRPALIEGGQVVGRLLDAVPGPIVQSLPRRQWFPA